MPNVFENDPMLAQIAANGRSLATEKGPAKTTTGAAHGDRQVLDDRGVSLPEEYRQELRRLRITAWRAMSIASSSHGPVVRGTESGGAVEHIGHYVTFAAEGIESPVCRMAVVQDPDGNKITIHKLK